MARPNLSLEHIAMALTALGTSAVLVACTKADSAAVHSDQPAQGAASTTAASPPPPPTQAVEGEKKPAEPSPLATAVPTASANAGGPPKRRMGGGGTGQASCGAGTCTADPKKK